MPVTVKVNVDQAGYATTNGVTLQKDVIAQANNPVVDNLLRAGAVVLGRTNTPAFSLRWFTSNQLHGDTRNPRNAALTPGGSSGGAAAAVAAGIGHIAHGTDIAGSIRYPAYACGVHGLRPTLGRVAAFNAALPERSLGGQITAVSGPWRAASPTCAWGWPRWPRPIRAIRGGRPRRWRGRPCRSAWRCVSIPMAWRPSPRWSRRCRTRPDAWARPAGASIRWTRSRR